MTQAEAPQTPTALPLPPKMLFRDATVQFRAAISNDHSDGLGTLGSPRHWGKELGGLHRNDDEPLSMAMDCWESYSIVKNIFVKFQIPGPKSQEVLIGNIWNYVAKVGAGHYQRAFPLAVEVLPGGPKLIGVAAGGVGKERVPELPAGAGPLWAAFPCKRLHLGGLEAHSLAALVRPTPLVCWAAACF